MNKEEREGHGMTVLLIEDDRRLADIVRTYLEHAGYRDLLAETGEEGMELVQRKSHSRLCPTCRCPGLVSS